ncbi:MAG TPA: putative maltokinase, partial [Rudaea sp.]
ECHMSFHFPLMPRMYMAIAKEDRFPITDIIRQTPTIPETCQWAIFLRNHDELTLEMVTDSERDYLWDVYASDRRARLNLGIRRRLAPLLERDRRRVELMNTLLLSMPGTPIIYYGDEIGMGDNVHLGDRDGVRTPMQWSPDRNGGFSRADPETLVLPPIQSPLYGFASVNVENQTRDAHSLLNWMRRMLTLRSNHRVFGAGTLTFLYPRNRKALAYLRELDGHIVLCVANLARSPQAVELDLRAFNGRVPVEMTAGTVFPAIGELPYLLTLPPFGFYWFELKESVEVSGAQTPAPEMLTEFSTLVVRAGVRDLSGDRLRAQLENEVLLPYLRVRRWFAGKNEELRGARLRYVTALSDDPAAPLLFEVQAETAGGTQHYWLPLGILWEGEDAPVLAQQVALARVRRGPRMGTLTDGFALPAFAHALYERCRNPDAAGDANLLRFEPAPDAQFAPLATNAIDWLSAEQSNSSLVIDKAVILKLLRTAVPGVQPEVEIGCHLARFHLPHVPAYLGQFVHEDADGTRTTVATLHRFVRNQGDAWNYTTAYLERLVDDHVRADGDGDDLQPTFDEYDAFAANIGTALGELHRALAQPSDDPAFAPEPAGAADIESWQRDAAGKLDLALQQLESAGGLDASAAELAARVRERRSELHAAITAIRSSGGVKTRVHGDFHLGQVLVSSGSAIIVDFEGPPRATIAERRAKSSPLRDVAGMLRSFAYAAGSVGNADNERLTLALREKKERALAQFVDSAARSFLDAYQRADRAFTSADEQLLRLFVIDKAAYEVSYELANRPTWVALPLRGLLDLAEAR